MWDERSSADGKYLYKIKIEQIEKLAGRYHFAATLVEVTDTSTGEKMDNLPVMAETYGAWPDEAVAQAASDADGALGVQ